MDAKPAALPTDEDQHMDPAAMAAAMRAPRPLLRGPGTTPSDAEEAPESPSDVPRWDEAPWAP